MILSSASGFPDKMFGIGITHGRLGWCFAVRSGIGGKHFAFQELDNIALFLFSGMQLDTGILNDTWTYDFQTNTWEEMIQSSDSLPLLIAIIAIPVIVVVIVIAYGFMKKRQ